MLSFKRIGGPTARPLGKRWRLSFAEVVAPANRAIFLTIGDSLVAGRSNANSARVIGDDPLPTGLEYSFATTNVQAIDGPLEFPSAGDLDRISPMERLLINYAGLVSAPVGIIPASVGGSGLQVGWNVVISGPGADLLRTVSAVNSAMPKFRTADATSYLAGVIIEVSSNDNQLASLQGWWLDLIDHLRANCVDITNSTPFFLGGPVVSGANDKREIVEKVALLRPNCYVMHPPFPTVSGDNLHPTLAEGRTWGANLATIANQARLGTLPFPTFIASTARYGSIGQPFVDPVNHTGLTNPSRYGEVVITGGTDAALFKIGGTFHAPTLEEVTPGTLTQRAHAVNLAIKISGGATGPSTPHQVNIVAEGQISPALLFTNNERGIVWDLSDTSTLFQDIAGTVPVTAAGQPVGKVLDKSPNANHWAALADNTTRPTYQVDTDGRPYLAFDGVNDIMIASVPFAGGNGDGLICSATIGIQGVTQSKEILGSWSTVSGSPFIRLLKSSTAALTMECRNDASGGLGVMASLATGLDNTKRVVTATFGGNNAITRIRDAAIGTYSELSESTLGQTTTTRASLGGSGAATVGNYFAGRIYSGYVINKAPSDTQIGQSEDWVSLRTNVTMPGSITNLSAEVMGAGIHLMWTASSAATSHEYRVNGGAWTITSAADNHMVNGLTASTLYSFEVRGVNVNGNGPTSNTATMTTAAATGLPTPTLAKTSAAGEAIKFSITNLIPDEVVGYDWYVEVGGGTTGNPDFTDGPGSETVPRTLRRQITYADFTGVLAFSIMDSLPNGFTAIRISIKADNGTSGAVSNVVSDTVTVYTDVAFSPTDKNQYITLSNTNRTMANQITNIGSWLGVRATEGRSEGKWYFEYLLNSPATGIDVRLGMGTSAPPITAFKHLRPGEVVDTILQEGFNYWASAGIIYNNNTSVTPGGGAATLGTVVGIAVDQDNKLFWISKNGVWIIGDPNTATGGRVYAATLPLLITATARVVDTNTNQATLRASAAEQSYAAPTGFLPYNGAT